MRLASVTSSEALDIKALSPAAKVDGLYVHVPFCFHKCHYCDFYSITRQTPDRMERFVDLVLREADYWSGIGNAPDFRIQTIFFGGGTPSLLPLASMRRLLSGLKDRFDFSNVTEWTIEVNPATANAEYCGMLRAMGVDRLSFGAQSFDRSELATLERHHDPADVLRSLQIARDAGFSRVNFDLIYAIPGQTLDSWSRSLEAAIALGTSHLSCYGLTYEPNTPMAVKKRLGVVCAVDEDIELQMLHHTRSRLKQAGLSAYEISNYATPGQECRHNLMYWTGGNYLGLGPSAASHLDGHRWRNRPHLGEWEQYVDASEIPAIDVEHLTPRQRAGELAMLMLRLSRGLIYDVYSARTGLDARAVYADQLTRLSKLGLLQLDDQGFHLTEQGIDVADTIASELLITES
jgi:oxygen-independent coproporphyrinogen-3 oxidase